MVVVGELVALSVEETGVTDDQVRWLELEHLNRMVVRLLGFAGFVGVEVWDASTQPATLPPEDSAHPPTGLHLVDITASRWGSTAGPRGRLMWAEIPVYARTESGLPRQTPSQRNYSPSGELSDPLISDDTAPEALTVSGSPTSGSLRGLDSEGRLVGKR